jgi:AcrR family transcriptional regulator
MAVDDELWPPFGPAAAFREQLARGRGGGRPGEGRPEREAIGRGGPGLHEPRGPHGHGDQRERQDSRGHGAQRGPGGARGQGGGHEPRGPRGRGRQGLSREEIVDVAIAIADSEGAEAVSMRKIAQVLRAGAMSLYWHLAGKEHLLELMLDALIADVDVPEPSGDWQQDLRVQARSQRKVLLRHRWVIDFIAARPPLGPNTLRNLDRSLAALDCLDIDTETAINILQTVNTYVLGAVLRELGELRVQREQEQWVTADTDFAAKLEQWRARLAATGMFDHFLRILRDDVDPDAEETRDERFEFGLDCVLEGVAAMLARAR